jgi:O-antigen ligase
MNKVKLENILFKIIEWGTYVALLTPLIVNKNYFFPFVVPKTIFFRIVVDIIFIAYVVLAVSNPKYQPKITPLTLATAAFLAVLFLTASLGVNFARSFWSVFERMTGLLTFLHLFVFYIVLTSVFKERKYWERILSVSVFIAALASLYTLFWGNAITNKAGGTLGNSSFLMSYLLFNIFFAGILLWLKSGALRILYTLELFLFLLLLFFNPLTITRGAVSAFSIGVVLFCTAYLFFSGNKMLKRLSLPFLIFMVILGIFIVKIYHFKDRHFNLLNIPDRSRQIVWSMGFKAWQERFWFGWGWENFNIPFAKYYNPELPATGDVWYDRVHNVILDTAVSSGIIGLLSYFAIFGLAIFSLGCCAKSDLTQAPPRQKYAKQVQKGKFLVSLTLIILLMVYFLQNLWVFDMISSYVMFFMTLAFIGFFVYPQNSHGNYKILRLHPFTGSFLVVLAVFALFYGNIQPARASKAIAQGMSLSLEQSLPAFQKALRLSPIAQFEGPERFALRIADFVQGSSQNKELLFAGFQAAAYEFEKALSKNPLDMRMYLFLGNHYLNFYRVTGDPSKLQFTQERLEKALELSPFNQQVYCSLAQLKIFQGRPNEAVEILQKAKDLEPRYEQAVLYLERAKEIVKNLDKSQ